MRNRAVDALSILLPEVFAARNPPSEWGDDWIFVPIDDPEAASLSGLEAGLWANRTDPGLEASQAGAATAWPAGTAVPRVEGTFPGAPIGSWAGSEVPPPDALAFYSPFHYFYPEWWGTYLIAEGVEALALHIQTSTAGLVSIAEATVAARHFLYGHEAYHHGIECFGARLEITHRRPLYRAGFEAVYRETLGTDDSLEEMLATAKGLAVATTVARRLFPHQPERARAIVGALNDYVERCPPGYRLGGRVSNFRRFEQQLFELSQQRSLPHLPVSHASLWAGFGHGSRGINQPRWPRALRRSSGIAAAPAPARRSPVLPPPRRRSQAREAGRHHLRAAR